MTKQKIPPIPEDYMPITPRRYQHVWTTGVQRNYHWLRSNQVNIKDFFAWVSAPKDGFRFGGFIFDGSTRKPNLTALSPIRLSWPKVEFTGIGDYLIFLPPDALESDIQFFLKDLLNSHYPLRNPHDLTDVDNTHFWNQIEIAAPIFYYRQDGNDFLVVCRDKEMLAKFMLSSGFQSSEERTKAELIAERPASWKKHFQSLGPECGPEKCVEEGCDNLRIKVAVRCVKHQLKSSGGAPFD